jgi:hypothetical protein
MPTFWEEDDPLKGTWQRDFLTPDSVIVGSSQASYRTYLTTWEEDEDPLNGLKGHGNEILLLQIRS